MEKRYLEAQILKDISKKMVFVAGPRQVGKTTLVKTLARRHFSETAQYLNWDQRSHRQIIVRQEFDPEANLLLLDELHKYHQWKNYLKGLYDTQPQRQMLVTGSARLDVYRKGGDSLQGRYHHFRLHPFSTAELLDRSQFALEPFQALLFPRPDKKISAAFEDLFNYGGFPEPLFAKNEDTLRRWQNQRVDRLVREEIRDLESLRDLSALQILVDILPDKVGSPLSLNALREDLEVAHKTMAHWMDILERFYYHFRIYPFQAKAIRSLRKEPKLYLWDWSQVAQPAARLENIIGSHLLKLTHYLLDARGFRIDLQYLRDREGREVDFIVTVDGRPWFAVEVKQSDDSTSKALEYFQSRLKIPHCFQLVHRSGVDVQKKSIRVISADRFCAGLI